MFINKNLLIYLTVFLLSAFHFSLCYCYLHVYIYTEHRTLNLNTSRKYPALSAIYFFHNRYHCNTAADLLILKRIHKNKPTYLDYT